MIPDEIVEQVAAQADIVAIIGEHVRLKKVGSVWRGPCPFHQGTNPNFSVLPRGGYTCFVCGEKGSVFTFVQKRLGMSFVEAVKYVGAKAGVDVPEVERKREGKDPREPLWELQATVSEYFQRTLWDGPSGAAARDYLAEREVSRSTADRFGLGFAPREISAMRAYLNGLGVEDERQLAAGLLTRREEQEELRPRFRDRLMFPILDESSHTVGFGGRLLGPGEPKYLNSSESEIFSKGRLLYNLAAARHAIRRAERALLVEGYFDALRLVDAGVEHVVAPMGTALTDAQADLLARYTKQVVLLYDSDGPGQRATFRAADVLLAKGLEVRVVTLPDGEDPDTFTRSRGRDAIEALIDQSLDVFDRKVQLLERAGWFKDLQHKRRALDRLVPTIRAASDPITRDLYLARAAEAAGIAREVLLQEVHTMRRGRTPARGVSTTSGRPHDPGAVSTGDRGSAGRPPIPSGPYRSPVEQGSAEAILIRVLLTQPVFTDQILEELGKMEAEELPEESDATNALADETEGILRDEVYRAIYEAVRRHGAEADPEVLTSELDPLAIHVFEEFRGEPDAVVDARRSISGALAKLRSRSIQERLRELESLLPLADSDEQTRLSFRINELARERDAVDHASSWAGVRRPRA